MGLHTRTRPHTGERGSGLISAIIGVGIASALSVLISQLLTNGLQGQRAVELRGEKEAIRQMLLGATSCLATLPTGSCTSGPVVLKRRLKDGSEPILVPAAGTKLGAYTVRADCAPSGGGVIVRAVRLAKTGGLRSTADGDFVPDPLTSKVIKWNAPTANLLGENVELCAGTGFNVTSHGANCRTYAPLNTCTCDAHAGTSPNLVKTGSYITGATMIGEFCSVTVSCGAGKSVISASSLAQGEDESSSEYVNVATNSVTCYGRSTQAADALHFSCQAICRM